MVSLILIIVLTAIAILFILLYVEAKFKLSKLAMEKDNHCRNWQRESQENWRLKHLLRNIRDDIKKELDRGW